MEYLTLSSRLSTTENFELGTTFPLIANPITKFVNQHHIVEILEKYPMPILFPHKRYSFLEEM